MTKPQKIIKKINHVDLDRGNNLIIKISIILENL